MNTAIIKTQWVSMVLANRRGNFTYLNTFLEKKILMTVSTDVHSEQMHPSSHCLPWSTHQSYSSYLNLIIFNQSNELRMETMCLPRIFITSGERKFVTSSNETFKLIV